MMKLLRKQNVQLLVTVLQYMTASLIVLLLLSRLLVWHWRAYTRKARPVKTANP